MTDIKPNIPAMRAVLAQIDLHPGTWDQNEWAVKYKCGTAFCFAGWATKLAGVEPLFRSGDDRAHQTTDGRDIDDAAQEILGLNSAQADALFDEYNSYDMLVKIVDHIAAGRSDDGLLDPDFDGDE